MGDQVELLPCPFCGGEAKIVYDGDHIPGHGAFIGCMNLANCFMPYRRFDRRNGERAAVSAWNTRTTTPAQAAKVLLEAMIADRSLFDAMTEAAETAFDAGASMNKALGNALRRAIAEGESK